MASVMPISASWTSVVLLGSTYRSGTSWRSTRIVASDWKRSGRISEVTQAPMAITEAARITHQRRRATAFRSLLKDSPRFSSCSGNAAYPLMRISPSLLEAGLASNPSAAADGGANLCFSPCVILVDSPRLRNDDRVAILKVHVFVWGLLIDNFLIVERKPDLRAISLASQDIDFVGFCKVQKTAGDGDGFQYGYRFPKIVRARLDDFSDDGVRSASHLGDTHRDNGLGNELRKPLGYQELHIHRRQPTDLQFTDQGEGYPAVRTHRHLLGKFGILPHVN